ncbi:hypothetical protein [Peribacillus glennii]|uniref:Uncharacterized protein n=1 Tax=Peribacillus glennii TaxID=2303991 RepID=A0A372L8K6_9BACI|nr:hypothetical protein [Peribacillus glennii]RFU61744.1 hypothetical protein D0466_16500 [Peribacillus glennii]
MSRNRHCNCSECRKFRQNRKKCESKDVHQHDHVSPEFGRRFEERFDECFEDDFEERFENRFENRFDKCFDRRFLCGDRFHLRLAGLQSGLAFRLRQLLDHDVKIECEDEEIEARIDHVGTDFIEVMMLKEKKNRRVKEDCGCKGKFRIIPFEKIKFVESL